ncbi:unknown protein [Seminavis robusta]|uniref:RING-type domain-containing protein n=1 Tax=Seminavis robusta TaxID=568900 RepID=A0A9N8HXK7_9STRA|nr:unknown protein [Seminavis robusta]|eukprot:Sro3168_g344710.1 n/a (346) ;mRNA; r:4567-5604
MPQRRIKYFYPPPTSPALRLESSASMEKPNPTEHEWIFRQDAVLCVEDDMMAYAEDVTVRSNNNWKNRQEFEFHIKWKHGGWHIENSMTGSSTFQDQKCVVCGHKNSADYLEKMKLGLHCGHVVCEECTHGLFYKYEQPRANDSHSSLVHCRWEAQGRGSNRDECPACHKKLMKTLLFEMDGQRIETSAPIPVDYMFNCPVYSESLADVVMPFYREHIEPMVEKYVELHELLDLGVDVYYRTEESPEEEHESIAENYRRLWMLHDFFEDKKHLLQFALEGHRKIPEEVYDCNIAFYRLHCHRIRKLYWDIEWEHFKILIIRANKWDPETFGYRLCGSCASLDHTN